MRQIEPLDYGRETPGLAGLIARASLPPAVAIVAWPLLYFTLFPIGLVLVAIVLIACAAWADGQSKSIALSLAMIYPNVPVAKLRRRVLVLQGIGIIGSWPLFGLTLDVLQSFGLKVGWS